MKTKSIFFYIFLLFIFTNFNTTTCAQAVNVQDSLALVDLYNSTDGPNWRDHTNWLTGPVKTWYGISVADTSVTEILLGYNNLNGNIPSSCGNLINLIYLDLVGNELSDNIPSELGRLIKLKILNLARNQLTGNIPSLSNLSNLNILDLSLNKLSGDIPASIDHLRNLSELDLSDNQLSGAIPVSIGKLNLLRLDLANNQLSVSIPRSIGNLTNLNTLSLEGNRLSGEIPSEFGNLLNLTFFDLSHNQFSGSIPPEIGNLVILTTFYLNNNQLSGSIPPSLGNLRFYGGDIRLSHNKLGGRIPFLNYVNFSSFEIDYNQFTFSGMEELVAYYRLANIVTSPQANIPLHQNENSLWVSAGGTLSNNTYKWFKVGKTGNIAIVGDSVFHPSERGKYYAAVTNSICTKLTLHTDTVFYDGVLTVTIINLKAYQQGKQNKVEWTSVTEMNVDRYEIQRSSNAIDFITIGVSKATGNGTQTAEYGFNDSKPLLGNNYYRLKVLDTDGKITYSNIVLVNMNNSNLNTLIYPVPANNTLTVETNGNTSFSIIDQSGRILFTTNINCKGTIDVSRFSQGLYFVKNNNTGAVQKMIIAR